MAANIINVTTTEITTSGGDESVLKLRISGADKITITTQSFNHDAFWRETGNYLARDYTITEGRNAYTVGPIELAPDVVVTIPDGSTWTVI